jgi:hypothetical protein
MTAWRIIPAKAVIHEDGARDSPEATGGTYLRVSR